ncbi:MULTISPECIES: hypothetical protein [Myxococcus]|uniref:Lipoprotein n=1 Tax=Myxococcus llanfairpwllgwyngyllgogerychwyrndrobwllllantysiliogogogochensis TaxID=2590453 RepID=A0A540X4H6_9BACT|nr:MULTISPECIES: hypothetical protein [Myxococcus]NTX02892.1 hypothetical protein [Myxococcus sp. CA040A]TQF16153.1 hypothetical protein FJV41_09605 [Myxococcus llanfairpwllgwyngyllgogerychwyrndrobwllllantysiliogogogochensis]
MFHRPAGVSPWLALVLTVVSGGAHAQYSTSGYRPRSTVPFKQLPPRDSKVGVTTVDSAVEGAALPNRAAFCKEVKAVLRGAGQGFQSLRGAPLKSYSEDVSVWESRKGIQDFRCTVYSTRALGDYIYCVQGNMECKPLQDRFHLYSSYLMETCAPRWNWRDSRLSIYDTYDPRRMTSATDEEATRMTLEVSRSKDSYSTCDLVFSVELL